MRKFNTKIISWGFFIFMIFVTLGAIVISIIILASKSVRPHTYCLPGFAPNDISRYGNCAECGINRYSADGTFCLDCPAGTYTCTNISTSISSCGKCLDFAQDMTTNSTICNSCA